MRKILDYLKEEHLRKFQSPLPSAWRINAIGVTEDTVLSDGSIPKQINGDDCGVFMCKFVRHIFFGKLLNFSPDVSDFRLQIARELRSGRLEIEMNPDLLSSLPTPSQFHDEISTDASKFSKPIPRQYIPGRIPLKLHSIIIPTRQQKIATLTDRISVLTFPEFMAEIDNIDRSCFLRYFIRTHPSSAFTPEPHSQHKRIPYKTLLKPDPLYVPDCCVDLSNIRTKSELFRTLVAKDQQLTQDIITAENKINRYRMFYKKDVTKQESVLKIMKDFQSFVKKMTAKVKLMKE